MMSEIGKNLKPTKLSIKPGTDRKISPNSAPDQFGQVNTAAKDLAGGNVPSTNESVRQHTRSDADSSAKSQHHTLGQGRNQASPGNHIHDGISSPKLGALKIGTSGNDPIPSLILTGAKGGNVALTNLIAMLKNHFNFTDNTT
jgi:hypothetical protein